MTGASGFVGAPLCRELLHHGHQVTVLLRGSSCPGPLASLPLRVVRGDVTDPSTVDAAVSGQQAVLHLASVIAYSRAARPLMTAVNVRGTEVVAEACLAHSCRLVHVSSMAAVGASEAPEVLDEDSEFALGRFGMGYVDTKRAAEEIVIGMVRKQGLDAVVVCPTNVYGPGDAQKSSRTTQVKVAQGKFPFYTRGGINVVHVEDCARGIAQAMMRGKPGERYILGGDNLTLHRVFQIIAEAGGSRPPWICLPVWVNFILGVLGIVPYEKVRLAHLYFWYSSEKARRELGFHARPAKEALEESVQWMKKTLPPESFKKTDASRNFILKALGLLAIILIFPTLLLFRWKRFR